ncbi:DUF2802 domain-containing protein [Oceanicoccus sp. KOV_DT_Chl]|uniref:DUF2802 domain-containing protein n=1 Tax=Oceanicoccus sp. KOV_DT_Chl TaxID=1904639 RepID=UPI000C7BC5C0|nr:DUF2802 domain-containing protein [Oceanicoccus sp. KOV_DT_Chl]
MTLVWVALVGCFVIAISAVVYTQQLNQRQQLSQQQSEQTIKQLQHELDVVNRAAMGVGQRLIHTEKKLKKVTEKQQQFDMYNGETMPYNLTSSWAEGGDGVEQLVERYGMPEAEASLLSLLKNRAAESH